MPTYEYAYEDRDAIEHRFTASMTVSEYKAEIPSPCGEYTARRVFTPVATHLGMTAAEKTLGTTKSRKEYGNWAKDMRAKRKAQHAPGTREHDSNEIWTGGEDLKGILPEDRMVKNVVAKAESAKIDAQIKEISQKKSL